MHSRRKQICSMSLMVLATVGCLASPEDFSDAEVGVVEQAIRNGNTEGHIFPVVRVNGNCSGTLVNDSWVVSAGHCFSNTSKNAAGNEVTYDGDTSSTRQTVAVDRILSHPDSANWPRDNNDIDVVLLHLEHPIRWAGHVGYSFDIWEGPIDNIGNGVVECAGFGSMAAGASCQDSGDCSGNQWCRFGRCQTPSEVMRWALLPTKLDIVDGVVRSRDHFQTELNSQLQATMSGDSGGGCFARGSAPVPGFFGSVLAGVVKAGSGDGSYQRHTAGPAFYRWANAHRLRDAVRGSFDPTQWDWGFCSSEFPCETGEGDCDMDSECLGDLQCHQDVGVQYGLPGGADVCGAPLSCPAFDANSVSWSFCDNGNCACSVGEGDCDNDFDCGAGLFCRQNIGAAVGMADNVDICNYGPLQGCSAFNPSATDWNFCSADCPCGIGEGDCDNDSECRGGLVCGQNSGAHFGKNSTFDVCVKPGVGL